MFQFLKDPNFDFMSRGKLALGISAVLVVASILILALNGLNLGIEFTGGTELQLKFTTSPDEARIRSALGSAGLANASLSSIGNAEDNEVYIRLGVADDAADEKNLTTVVTDALRGDGVDAARDLNILDTDQLTKLLQDVPGVALEDAGRMAAAITETRRDAKIFTSIDGVDAVPGISPAALDYLKANTDVGPLSIRSQSYIGPAIGSELLNKALMAITGSLIGMLLYIWARFQLQWGFAAVVSLTHDTLITLGLFSLFDKEMSLPVVAAFLTLVGYSVNDTVVVFDRIRENVGKRISPKFGDTINVSINQTLSRTIITSGLTWIVVFGLYIFGSGALNSFAFVLSVGVLVGTYSSIFIASPLLVLWQRFFKDRAAEAAGQAKPARTG